MFGVLCDKVCYWWYVGVFKQDGMYLGLCGDQVIGGCYYFGMYVIYIFFGLIVYDDVCEFRFYWYVYDG